ncbi:MAG: tRNA pseudouridine(55) synthase TruB [Prevotella sp.]|nr:tRNA pseudouridine(55) synthase TruB [Prevotella sp.]
MNFHEGEIIGIDKPYGMSSFSALSRVRYILTRKLGVKKIKIGHAGTLDPLATGVLILCTGKATKRIDELQRHTKEYTATLQLGATTPSFDMEHPIDNTFPTSHITFSLIDETLKTFVGEIQQVPPAYSACKINGKRAYKLMRKGNEVQLKPKTLVIEEIELLSFDMERMQLCIRVVCGKGTYIRALARDIGKALNSGAYLTALRRMRVGDVKIEDCISLDGFGEWLEKQTIEDNIIRGN